jgi:hypothetical protein
MAEKNNSASRRNVLKAAGAIGGTALGGAGVVAGEAGFDVDQELETTDDGDSRTVTVRARSETSYEFSVTGVLTPTDAPATAVGMGAASATLSRGAHKFSFSGEFTAFELDGDAEVVVDGESFDVAAFPRNRLEIVPSSGTEIDVSASGRVESDSRRLDSPNARTVTGTVADRTVLEYAGELTYLDVGEDTRLVKNGRAVSVEEALPNALPGEATVDGAGSQVELSVSGPVRTDGAALRADGESVSGRPSGRETFAYDGAVDAVTHENGATVTIRPDMSKFVCEAPADQAVTVVPEGTDGIVNNGELETRPTVTVAAGETKYVKYFGEPTGVNIEDTTVTFNDTADEGAVKSALLQKAAKLERRAGYAVLADDADGRVRHDAYGVQISRLTPDDDQPKRFAKFELADVSTTRGILSMSVDLTTDELFDARVGYETKTEFNTLEKVRVESVDTTARTIDASSVSSETHTFDAETGTVRQSDVQKEFFGWDPFDFLGDLFDGAKDFVSDIPDVAADTFANAVDNLTDISGIDETDYAIMSGKFVAQNAFAAGEMLKEFATRSKNLVWKTGMVGGIGVFGIAGSGAFTNLLDGDFDCAGCIAAVKGFLEVAVCEFGVSAFCGLSAIATLGFGGIGCLVMVGAVCSFATGQLFDAEKICSSYGTPTELHPC